MLCLEQAVDVTTMDDHAYIHEKENPTLITHSLQEFYCWNIYIIDSNITFLKIF